MVNPQPASSKYKQSHMPYVVGIVAFFAFFEVCPILPRKNETPFLQCYVVAILSTFSINRKKKNLSALHVQLVATSPIETPKEAWREGNTKHGLRQHDWPFSNWRNWSSRFSVSPVWSCGFMAIENVGVVILWWHGCCFKRPWTCSKKKRWI